MALQLPPTRLTLILPPIALSPTTYHCTASSDCSFTTTTYETWVSHELAAHPDAHSVWYCHSGGPLPVNTTTAACSLAFPDARSFNAHFVYQHAPPLQRVPFRRDNNVVAAYDNGAFAMGPGTDLFWCGFCRRVWSCFMTHCWRIDRFEHVAAHFAPYHARWAHYEMQNWAYLEVWMPLMAEEPVAGHVVAAEAAVEAAKAAIGLLAEGSPSKTVTEVVNEEKNGERGG